MNKVWAAAPGGGYISRCTVNGRNTSKRRDPDDFDGEDGEVRPGMPIDIHRVTRALRRGTRWLGLALVLGLAAGSLIAKFAMTNIYSATAVLKYEGLPDAQGSLDPREGQARLEAFRLEGVLSKIKRARGLSGNLASVAALIQVEHETNTDIIRIDASDDSAGGAAAFANTVAEVFLGHHEDARKSQLEDDLRGLEQRIEAANADLGRSRQAYDDFRRRNGISDLSTEQEQGIASSADLRARANMAKSEVSALEARVSQLQRELASAPLTVVSASNNRSPEAEQLAQLEGQLATARARLSDEHPRVQALQQQIATLRDRIRTGKASDVSTTTISRNSRRSSIQTALSSAQADLEAARQRGDDLERLASSAQERVTQFSGMEGEASTLLAEVRVKEALSADLANQRVHVEDALREPSSGFRWVARATEPEHAKLNKMKYVVAGGLPLGLLLLAALYLLGREFRGFRMYTAREVGYWGKGPVIGTTTWPRDPRAVRDLIADMDDYAPEARGRMLVVGASEVEAELAHEIVDQLNNDWFPTTVVDLDAYSSSDAPPSDSSALALRQSTSLAKSEGSDGPQLEARAWDGPHIGQGLRRAARLADRVAVVITSGTMTARELAAIPNRLGREDGLGYILVGIESDLAELPDRAGPVVEFWAATRE